MFRKKITIKDWQLGLLYARGVFVKQLGPGLYKIDSHAGEEVFIYDTRPVFSRVYQVDFATADKLGVQVTATIPRRIVDPLKVLSASVDIEAHVTTAASRYLSAQIRELTVDTVQDATPDLAKGLQRFLEPLLLEAGIEQTDEIYIEVSLPRNIKRAFEAEIVAKKKALADLEEARGKTAVLRHLANSAKLVEENPALYKLLLSQKVRSLSVQMDEK